MSVRILHTADLHFGKKLHKKELLSQQREFVKWLRTEISEKSIQYLIVAGDVFDMANPSAEAMALYYEFLRSVYETGCHLVITAGNHDSAAVLDAPKDLLRGMGISITGSAAQNLESCIIPVKDQNGNTVLLITAVPFLRDADIRRSISGEAYSDRVQAIKDGIKGYYDKIAEHCLIHHGGIPVITTGHLFATGASTSDSEREIQVGNLAGIDNSTFHELYNYVALGHIHRPQEVGKEGRIFYSGSPYPLSFSEAGQKKSVRILEFSNGILRSECLEVPQSYELIILSGDIHTINQDLQKLGLSGKATKFIELEVKESLYDPIILRQVEDLISRINSIPGLEVVHHQISFENQPVFQIENLQASRVDQISPSHVFQDLISAQPAEKQEELNLAFMQLFDEVNSSAN